MTQLVARPTVVGLGLLLALLCALAPPAAAQVTSGSIVGSVRDQQGAVIPGATITMVSATRGTSTETTTNVNGDFSFTNVLGDTYTLRVTMDGFKTLERPNVPVSPGDRVVVPALVIEVGALNETITVTGDAPMIQAQSGERSFVVTTEAVQNLPVANRNFASLATLVPGVVGTTRLGGGGQNNFQIDGVSIMDTGNNGQMLQTNVEAIAEVRVVTQGYSAEYGRSSGLQISGTTKSGTNQFRGSVYDIQRHSRWNTNSWANTQNGIAQALSDQHDWGYTFGGPVGKPGGQNKLFFFYAHELRPRAEGGGTNRFRVPTLLERRGDFSQSTDRNGALVNLIRDPTSTSPCTAANTAGCFADGGVLGRIPANRLYPLGLNILKLWPEPNTSGLDYNFETRDPEDKRLTQQPMLRLDYQLSQRLRLNGKYTGQRGTVKVNEGSIPGFNDTLQNFPFVSNFSATADWTIGTGTVVEFNWGFIRNQLGSPLVTQASNRCNVGLCDLPFLYPDAGIVNPDYYQKEVMDAINAPFYVDGRILLPPTFAWGNRITNAPPNLSYPNFLNINRTNDFAISMTKLAGRHTMKAGFYLNHSYKAQNFGIGGATPFQGAIDFSNDTNNPLDTGFGFSNAAVGVFTNYGQQSKLVEGSYIYNNVEWYVQDNWKASDRLTLDYGVRFTHQQPQYDQFLQSSNFFIDEWNQANAPLLYRAGCLTASPCSGANRVAVNPQTGATLGASSAAAIGTVIPNTGDRTNGLKQAGQGIAKENYTWPFLGVAPRFGAAYDLTGSQDFVVRGSVGLFFDRPDGNSVYNQVSNPPFSRATNVRYATLQSLGVGGFSTDAAPTLSIFTYDSPLPKTVQWNVGFQKALPWAAALDVSYVGNHAYDILQAPQAGQPIDINAVDFGAAFLPQNQDPTLPASSVPGARAVATDLMRPIRGYAAINTQMQQFYSTYHSIQTSLNRRFRNGVQFTVNYTLGLSNTGNTGAGNNPQPLRLEHNADGTFQVRADQAELEELMKDVGNRPHTVRVNGVWDLPNLSAGPRVLQYIANDWQLAGVFTGGSAAPYDATFTYNANGSNVNLTGSPNYAARIRLVGDPGSGCSSNQYAQFNTAAFAGPQTGSLGLESGRNLLRGCADHTTDLSISRNIRLGGARLVQFRLDMYNAFNTVIYNGRVTALQLNSPTDQTVRNPQFNADGSPVATRLRPQDAGFGAVTGAQGMRTMQAQIRFQF
jgi:hypothetical protein